MTQKNIKKEPIIIEDSDEVEISLFFSRFKGKISMLWPWIIISTVVCLVAVFIYLKIVAPAYKIHASLLVQDDQKGAGFGDMSVLQDFGILSGKSNVDNEAEILKSHSLMENVEKKLHLNVAYFIKGKFKATEVYAKRPLNVEFIGDTAGLHAEPLDYSIQFDGRNNQRVKFSDQQKTVDAKLGDTLRLAEGMIIINEGPGFSSWPTDHTLLLSIFPADLVIRDLSETLLIEIPNKQVSVVYLTINQTLPEKGTAILNTLISEYMQGSVDDKNRIAESTIKFIDDRLKLVTGELQGVEKEIEEFKTTNKLTDITEQSRIMLENTSEYARQQTAQEVALSVVEGLEQFLKDNKNNSRVVPSSLVIQDPGFLAIINRYNQAKLERDKMLMSLTPQHPSVLTLDAQLVNMNLELLSSISSIKKGISVSINELKKRTSSFAGEISKVPSKERVFLDISRQQAIKQELYVFLLKKREETAITMSANIASARIIDSAKPESLPFKPKKLLIFLTGLLVGLVFPFAVSFAKDALNTKISSLKDITSVSKVPILAEIGHNKGDLRVITVNSRDVIAEQIRAMRTNLQYLLSGKTEKTIMITSSMGSEGKTFLSINLCAVLAFAGKKVILLEFDLRKPKITKQLNLKGHGFTNYILSDNNDWLEWIQPSGIHKNFQVLGSGHIPPNPTELLMLEQTSYLFNDLKNHFDYVIVDTPPAGLITDAEIIATYADVTLYMVRHRVTFKEQIKLINKFYQKKVFPRMNIIVNDVDFKNTGYGYGYGSDYGNYGQDAERVKKRVKADKV
ncbi:MAG: polysaccharide biosynthesis tyrosine autokinase [Chitinophagaceae bacterium]